VWAQLITVRLQPGKEAALAPLFDQLDAIEQPGSGLVQHLALQDVADPTLLRILTVFESEEQARAREQDPRREAGLVELRAMMGELFEGPPTFNDLDVIAQRSH
jgi:heme-degrading monooxygenase HmoA